MASAHHERPGHHWRDPAQVARYVERTEHRAKEQAGAFALMVQLMPFPIDAEIKVLDIGAGYGAVAAVVLDVFPNARAIGLDISAEMMRVGNERMARYGGRFRYVEGDFGDGVLPLVARSEGPFHTIVSALAIHHLPPVGIASLYRSAYAGLLPGGCFFNIDVTDAVDDYLREQFQRIRQREEAAHGVAAETSPSPAVSDHYHGVTVSDHLGWLRDAGFQSVDCFWKQLATAMVGGYRRS